SFESGVVRRRQEQATCHGRRAPNAGPEAAGRQESVTPRCNEPVAQREHGTFCTRPGVATAGRNRQRAARRLPSLMEHRPRPEHPPLDPEQRQQLIERFNDVNRDRFGGHLGYHLMDVRRGWARIEVDCTSRIMNPSGVMHGGASFGLADSAVAAALLTIYGPGVELLTHEVKITYLQPIVSCVGG